MIVLFLFVLFFGWNAIGSIIVLSFINSDLVLEYSKYLYRLCWICTPIMMLSEDTRSSVKNLAKVISDNYSELNKSNYLF